MSIDSGNNDSGGALGKKCMKWLLGKGLGIGGEVT